VRDIFTRHVSYRWDKSTPSVANFCDLREKCPIPIRKLETTAPVLANTLKQEEDEDDYLWTRYAPSLLGQESALTLYRKAMHHGWM
jgi:hypothetical protein